MRQTIWNKRIPTLLGIFFLLFSITVTSLFVRQGTSIVGRATSDKEPVDVRVSNVSDTTATLSFTTQEATIATVSYGLASQTDTVVTDVRDQAKSPTPHTTHMFTLSNLAPSTPYFFAITSGGTTYQQNGEQLFQFTTAPSVTFTSPPDTTITGKILSADGEIGKDVLVYITSESAQTLSVLTGIDGAFSVSLQNLRSSDLQQPLGVVQTAPFILVATDGKDLSTVSFITQQANPLPTITLSHNYDFSLLPLPLAPVSDTAESLPILNSSPVAGVPQIISPTNRQVLTDTQPVLQGTGQPNERVEITIPGSVSIQARVLTNKQGAWRYRPTTPLSPGTYTLTITTKDAKGKSVTITRAFIISAQAN